VRNAENPVSLIALETINLALNPKEKEEIKRRALEKLVTLTLRTARLSGVLPRIQHLLKEIEEALKSTCEFVLKVKIKSTSRFLVHSREGITYLLFEGGTVLHPVFGIPYIPSSSIKGALRSYLASKGYDENKLKTLFGGLVEGASRIIITDAYLTSFEGKIIEPEVTTPIYREPREDRAKPVPIIYPVIAPGVKFTFFVGLKKGAKELYPEIKKDILHWILSILKEGLGAKTSLGYGEFSGEFKWTRS